MSTRTSLVESVIERVLDRIVSGEFPEGAALPPEDQLAEQSGASRLTTREAVKLLAAQGVLRPVQGRGTFVNPVHNWTAIEAVARMQRGAAADVIAQLVQVRAMIEVGAAELFAQQGDPTALDAMEADLRLMRSAHQHADVAAFVAADLDFHNRILTACGNPFVPTTFLPISRVLREARVQTSSVATIREHAINEHAGILTALRSRSVSAAGAAMRSHLRQTEDDARHHLGSDCPAGGAMP
jgi:GntR family transcriptional repressor for pyruvate dehydrogenase complex